MARNIEIKATIESIHAILPLVKNLASAGPFEIHQDDTFFHCPNGRLKLRAFSQFQGELIFYQRSDQTGPKESFYVISKTCECDSLREALSLAYGQSGRVIKERTLYLAGRTRIHLDRVQGLGEYLELEVVLADGESSDSGTKVAVELLKKLEVSSTQLIQGAYVDLLSKGI